jgi:ABC-type phosphate transport system permease subunit
MPDDKASDAAINRWSGYVVRAGLVIVVAGLLLSFLLVALEFRFQLDLLEKFGTDYKWKPIGVSYIGVVVIAIGALMTAFAAVIALRGSSAARRPTSGSRKNSDKGKATA